jgi:subtilisin-like proprotein convertase family protein
MKRIKDRASRVAVLLGAVVSCLCVGGASPQQAERGQAAPGQVDAATAAGLGVSQFTIETLALEAQPGKEMVARVALAGVERRLILRPYSTRSEEMVAFEQLADGTLRYVEPPAERTYRGIVEGEPESLIAASLTNEGELSGVVLIGQDGWGIEPLRKVDPAAPAAQHVVYRAEDVRVPEGVCGVLDAAALDAHDHPLDEGGIAGSGVSGGEEADIAFDADFEFFQLNGSSTANTITDIETVMNIVEAMYHRDLGITFRTATIIVRTTAADPYSSTDPNTLLGQFAGHWNTVQAGVTRDLAQLYTGKELNGTTIGLALLGQVCIGAPPGGAYSLVQSRWSPNILARASLSAHEIGHNFNAQHCDAQADCGVMCSGLGGCTGNLTRWGNLNTNQIVAWRNGTTCMSALGACCVGSVCTQLSATDCAEASGTWTPGVACTTRTTYTATPGVPIPDGSPVGVTTTMTVPDSFIISDLNLKLVIPHTWVGDLIVDISHNGGPFRRVVDRIFLPGLAQGCPADDLNVWLDDEAPTTLAIEGICPIDADFPSSGPSFRPNQLLSIFDGQDAQGTWTIRAFDLIPQDDGEIVSWTLDIERADTTFCVPQGACCILSTCSQTSEAACDTAGGAWTAGATCFQATVFSSSPNLNIPDGSPAGVSNTINIPDDFTISDLNVNLVINHTWVGDLIVRLSHNGGPPVTLIDRPGIPGSQFGCSANHYDVTLDDEGQGILIEMLCGEPINPVSPPNYRPNALLSAFDGQNIGGSWTLTVADFVTPDPGTLVSWGISAQDVDTNACLGGEDCPADIDGSNAVDVDDLVAVILGWGCANPPGPCPADVDDSGLVDVDDLVAVILAWGACP